MGKLIWQAGAMGSGLPATARQGFHLNAMGGDVKWLIRLSSLPLTEQKNFGAARVNVQPWLLLRHGSDAGLP